MVNSDQRVDILSGLRDVRPPTVSMGRPAKQETTPGHHTPGMSR